jgi:hypothetical protein
MTQSLLVLNAMVSYDRMHSFSTLFAIQLERKGIAQKQPIKGNNSFKVIQARNNPNVRNFLW